MFSDQDRPAGPPPNGKPPMDMSNRPAPPPNGAPPNGQPPEFPGGFGGPGSSSEVKYSAATEITSAASEADKSYTSNTAEMSSLIISTADNVTLTNPTVMKTDASGANGVFSYGGNGGQNGAAGDGTKVIIKDTKIVTSGSGSGGIMTTGGGITEAYNLDITTNGQSSAPIRSDRGGGTVIVDGGTYVSNGLGSTSRW